MIYLDNASTTPLSNQTKEYIISLLDDFGNPSSKHNLGERSKKIIEEARANVAKFIGCESDEIYFTSSGSASNALGIKGYARINGCDILYSPIAHKSIIKCVNNCENKSTPIPVNENGEIVINELERLCLFSKKPLVIIDYVNSELGVIQQIDKIAEIVHFYNGVLYVDCTASISSIHLNVKTSNIDMCGFSGHKIGALKGCGVFYKKKDIFVEPLIFGNQEGGLIGGTENLLGIATIGKVVSEYDYSLISSEKRDYMYNRIVNDIPNTYLVGDINNRVAHNLYICFKDVDAESLMLMLDLDDIQVSTGSACNSTEVKSSYVLEEINMPKDDRYSCIRMTFSGSESIEELDFVCKKIKFCVEQLRNMKV